jgi:hypothetical protein
VNKTEIDVERMGITTPCNAFIHMGGFYLETKTSTMKTFTMIDQPRFYADDVRVEQKVRDYLPSALLLLLVRKHLLGDWGDASESIQRDNQQALSSSDGVVISKFRAPAGYQLTVKTRIGAQNVTTVTH